MLQIHLLKFYNIAYKKFCNETFMKVAVILDFLSIKLLYNLQLLLTLNYSLIRFGSYLVNFLFNIIFNMI